MKAALREPLVRFVLLGALLFAYFEWSAGASGSGTSLVPW
jgi:hypothetical protein